MSLQKTHSANGKRRRAMSTSATSEGKGDFPVYPVDVEDLIDNEVLSKRQHIGKGELSSMVFARKIRQALLTDDQRTRRLAVGPLDTGKIQTTPHLAGWLFFE